ILNGLAFIERAQSRTLHRRNMDEHVLAAGLRLNESIAFCWVEPLHGPCRHRRLLRCSANGRVSRPIWSVRVLGDDLMLPNDGSSKADRKLGVFCTVGPWTGQWDSRQAAPSTTARACIEGFCRIPGQMPRITLPPSCSAATAGILRPRSPVRWSGGAGCAAGP